MQCFWPLHHSYKLGLVSLPARYGFAFVYKHKVLVGLRLAIPVGLPILAVLDNSSVEGTYLGRVLLIWLFSMATVLIVIAPKIFNTWRNPTLAARSSRVFVSGITASDGPTSHSNFLGHANSNSTSSQASPPRVDQEQPLNSSTNGSVTREAAVSSISKTSERLEV
jgi:hypothetical protein